MVDIGKALKELRARVGITQRSAANQVGVTYPHMSNVENGSKQPSWKLLADLSTLYGIDVYVYAWLKSGDLKCQTALVQKAATQLLNALTKTS